MRKFLFILALVAAVFVMACEPPVAVQPEPAPRVYVYDSKWALRDSADAIRAVSRAVDGVPVSLQAYVDEYNAVHTDDQLFITDGEVPVTEAPTCRVRIVDSTTYEPEFIPGTTEIFDVTVPRAEVMDRFWTWELTAQGVGGAILYVDKTPPAPIPPPPPDLRPDYEKYAIYLIDEASQIVPYYEDHCEDISDYPSKQAYFEFRRYMFELEARGHPGWRVVAGELYSPPQE